MVKDQKPSIISYIMRYKKQFIISTLGGVFFNTVLVLGPIFLGLLIDTSEGAFTTLLMTAFFYVGVTALFQFARYIKRWFMRDQFNHIASDLRQDLTEKVLSFNMNRLSKESAGDLMSRSIGDVNLFTDTVMVTINESFDTFLMMISYFVSLLIINPRITLLSSVMIPTTIILAHYMRNPLYKYSMAVRVASSGVNVSLKRYLDGVFTLRLFGREENEVEKTTVFFKEQSELTIREQILKQSLLPLYSLIAGIGVVVAFGLLADEVVAGNMSIGIFNSYILMFVTFTARSKRAADVFNRWHGAKAAWNRIKEKLETIDDKTQKTAQKTSVSTLTVKGLTFGFDENAIVNDICFTAGKGEIIGVTGPVGCGKTSLAKALTGLYTYSGSIKADDVELRTITDQSRAKLISYTGHEQSLFSMTVEGNIVFDDKQTDSKLFADSVKVSALRADIEKFDKGITTEVGEKGTMVSGGQRQRIALARTFYADTEILILDDPFSAVDILTEQEIIGRMREMYKDKIVILFTHRLSAFSMLDKVLLMGNGRITAEGSHEELVNRSGLYQSIYKAQEFLEVSDSEI